MSLRLLVDMNLSVEWVAELVSLVPSSEASMDQTTVLHAVQAWPVEEQIGFLFRLWDQLIEGGWQPEASDELKAELDRRLAAYQANSNRVVTWEQVVAHVRQSPRVPISE